MSSIVTNLAYIVASGLFIYGIKMLGRTETARRGNLISAIGMLLAVLVTLAQGGLAWTSIAAGVMIGAIIGGVWARVVKMTGMPELVALFNGFGGLASVMVAWSQFHRGGIATSELAFFTATVAGMAVLIGAITFSGSLIAYGKLSEKISGRPIFLPCQKLLSTVVIVLLALSLLGMIFLQGHSLAYPIFLLLLLAALTLGVLSVLPIGGGDMPVVISLLNSLSGLAASAAGFAIQNNVLIVAGCLVGCSGLVLTIIMCKAMNRSLRNVLFSGFGAQLESDSGQVEGEMRASSVEDAYYVLEAARNVVIVPGYGMAVAQAQHAVRELGDLLEANGTEVRYVIHPVAGRMPGHMNVLLAEADVPYEQLVEMETANPTMAAVDVAIVIGANDVVNPAAANDPASPIYGMPIVNVHEVRTVFALKRGQGAGFSGLINQLYFLDKTRMLYGDAKATVSALLAEFKK